MRELISAEELSRAFEDYLEDPFIGSGDVFYQDDRYRFLISKPPTDWVVIGWLLDFGENREDYVERYVDALRQRVPDVRFVSAFCGKYLLFFGYVGEVFFAVSELLAMLTSDLELGALEDFVVVYLEREASRGDSRPLTGEALIRAIEEQFNETQEFE